MALFFAPEPSFSVCIIIGTMNTSDYLFADVQFHFRLYAISLHHLIDVKSRFSPVSLDTVLACRYPYTAGFLGIAFRVLHTFFCLRH